MFQKNLDGLNDNILKLRNLLDYADNNFIVYEDVKFGHLRYKKYDYVTNQITTKYNNTTVLIAFCKDGTVKICDSSGH